jgi:hypothetical protein
MTVLRLLYDPVLYRDAKMPPLWISTPAAPLPSDFQDCQPDDLVDQAERITPLTPLPSAGHVIRPSRGFRLPQAMTSFSYLDLMHSNATPLSPHRLSCSGTRCAKNNSAHARHE